MEPPFTGIPDVPSGDRQVASEGGLLRRRAARIQARLQPVVRVAAAMVDKVRSQAALALASGLWVWGLIFSKELLLQFTVVARVANPVFIGLLFVAFVLSLLLIVAAAVSLISSRSPSETPNPNSLLGRVHETTSRFQTDSG
jgi:hypothetical protein